MLEISANKRAGRTIGPGGGGVQEKRGYIDSIVIEDISTPDEDDYASPPNHLLR